MQNETTVFRFRNFIILCLGFALLLHVSIVKAQVNLVPNPSFEQMDSCPYTLSQTHFAEYWTSFKQTPDYYNSCAGFNNLVGIPYNAAGYQQANTGNAYMGLQTFFTPGAREILGSQLINPLIIGNLYYLSLYTNCGYDTSLQGAQFGSASNNLGIKFSTVSFSVNNPVPINNFAHLYSDTILQDTVGWFHLSGSFIADSAYHYIMIGNFFDDLNTDTIRLNNFYIAYYLIDDVCVNTIPECSFVNVNEKLIVENIIFYNFNERKLIIENSNGENDLLLIFDYTGKIMYNSYINCLAINEVYIGYLHPGFYIAKIISRNKEFTLKFIVN